MVLRGLKGRSGQQPGVTTCLDRVLRSAANHVQSRRAVRRLGQIHCQLAIRVADVDLGSRYDAPKFKNSEACKRLVP